MSRRLALLLLLLPACQRPEPPAPAPTPPPTPAPIQAQPLAAPAVDLTRHPWADRRYTIDLDGQPLDLQLTARRAQHDGPTPGATLHVHLDEITYGDLDGDGQQDAVLGLSAQILRQQEHGPPRLERAWVHIDLYTWRGGAPALTARHTEPGAAISWLDITDEATLNVGVLTRPEEKFNAVDELTLRLDDARFTLTDRHKSYSD
jgi:hypothetical protein